MKEFEAKVSARINLVPTAKMVQDARERVARTLGFTREHILESQLDSEAPFEKKPIK